MLVAAALAGLYQARRSEEILSETERNIANQIGTEKARERIQALRELLPEAMVTGYARHLAGLENDEKDRHVVAAAIASKATIIVTGNLADFRPIPHRLRAMLPDTFLCGFLDQLPALLDCLEIVRNNWPNPPPHERLLSQLEVIAPQFVNELRVVL